MFEKVIYIVNRLDGDYAYLCKQEEDGSFSSEEKCVARALLPAEIDEKSMLAYEMLEYSLL